MGQYQQWLYYQEVDRRLRADLEALETELARNQEQSCTLEQTIPPIENIIIRALAASLNRQSRNSGEIPARPFEDTSSAISEAATASASETTLAPALYGWGRLPNFGQEDMQEPISRLDNSVPLTLHPEMALLPEDMVAFIDAHDPTDPQLELPWWRNSVASSTNGAHSSSSMNKESMHTNHLVQRLREPWGQPGSIEQPSEKSEDAPDE